MDVGRILGSHMINDGSTQTIFTSSSTLNNNMDWSTWEGVIA